MGCAPVSHFGDQTDDHTKFDPYIIKLCDCLKHGDCESVIARTITEQFASFEGLAEIFRDHGKSDADLEQAIRQIKAETDKFAATDDELNPVFLAALRDYNSKHYGAEIVKESAHDFINKHLGFGLQSLLAPFSIAENNQSVN